MVKIHVDGLERGRHRKVKRWRRKREKQGREEKKEKMGRGEAKGPNIPFKGTLFPSFWTQTPLKVSINSHQLKSKPSTLKSSSGNFTYASYNCSSFIPSTEREASLHTEISFLDANFFTRVTCILFSGLPFYHRTVFLLHRLVHYSIPLGLSQEVRLRLIFKDQ